MMLGFILATSHLYVIKYPFSAQLVLGSMFLFAYPALDVTYAFYRRICNRTPIFLADKGHIHHVLQGIGFSIRKTIAIIYSANVLLASIGVILLTVDIPTQVIFVFGMITAIALLLLLKKLLIISSINCVS
jgi:UDP-GlcNAc:undecaprenyl-phosphate/decaprenyl-phosphate GlcNAc-1-phosphate transferase